VIEWPSDVSGDAVERACEAARMGVDTAVVLGNTRLRAAVQENLAVLAKDGEFCAYGDVSNWTFKGGGELTLAANLHAARAVHLLRHVSSDALEVVYPKANRV
jgi:hypothetical protein